MRETWPRMNFFVSWTFAFTSYNEAVILLRLTRLSPVAQDFHAQLACVPYLVLYQLVVVNHGEFASSDCAEIFGSSGLGISRMRTTARFVKWWVSLPGLLIAAGLSN